MLHRSCCSLLAEQGSVLLLPGPVLAAEPGSSCTRFEDHKERRSVRAARPAPAGAPPGLMAGRSTRSRGNPTAGCQGLDCILASRCTGLLCISVAGGDAKQGQAEPAWNREERANGAALQPCSPAAGSRAVSVRQNLQMCDLGLRSTPGVSVLYQLSLLV